MHSQTPTQQYLARIDSFADLIAKGLNAWVEAGRILADLVDELGEDTAFAAVERKIPGVGSFTLSLFVRVGRREIHPCLLTDSSRGSTMVAGLPFDEQERVWRDGVQLWRLAYDEWEVITVPVSNLTGDECEQVFDRNRLRTAAEQKKIVTEQDMRRKEAAEARRQRREEKGAPRPHTRHSIDTGSRAGWEPDRPAPARSLDELSTMQPIDLLRDALERAQVALIESRRHLAAIRKGSKLDDQITAALLAVGNLRYAANHGEL